MDEQIQNILQELKTVKERNKRVEADKAWETSKTRIASISLITYIVASLVMLALKVSNPFLNALIPTIGFFLSTQSLPIIKKRWVEKYIK